MAIAAALIWSGISVITTTSYSPNAINPATTFPPSFSIGLSDHFHTILRLRDQRLPAVAGVGDLMKIVRHEILLFRGWHHPKGWGSASSGQGRRPAGERKVSPPSHSLRLRSR